MERETGFSPPAYRMAGVSMKTKRSANATAVMGLLLLTALVVLLVLTLAQTALAATGGTATTASGQHAIVSGRGQVGFGPLSRAVRTGVRPGLQSTPANTPSSGDWVAIAAIVAGLAIAVWSLNRSGRRAQVTPDCEFTPQGC